MLIDAHLYHSLCLPIMFCLSQHLLPLSSQKIQWALHLSMVILEFAFLPCVVLVVVDLPCGEFGMLSEGMHESVGNPVATCVSDTRASVRKDVHVQRTSSCSDASASGTSFIDMLKKPVLPETDVASGAPLETSDDGIQAGRNGKKKGKKGRQIDPTLLGFKVSSNRILMGEIQRPKD